MAESSGSSVSSSSSTPVVLNTPQSDWALQLSQLLNALGQSQYAWALNQVSRGQAITDQNIAQFVEQSGKGAGLAQTLIQQYEQQFSPMIRQYLDQANTYNSEARQRFMMGRAESQVAQADTAARNETERKLQGVGVNVSAGRYQDVIAALRMQDAAARAGAGTQAALDTADRGRAMTEKAIQFGQNVPGMAVNALNSAYQGITGAQNANLGQQNTAANLTSSAAPFFNTAAGANKLPLMGQQSSSGSASQQSSSGREPTTGTGRTSGSGDGHTGVNPQYADLAGRSGGGGGSSSGSRNGSGGEVSGGSMRGPFGGGSTSGVMGGVGGAPWQGGEEFGTDTLDAQQGWLDQLGTAAENPDWGGTGGGATEPYYPYGDQESMDTAYSPDYGAAPTQDFSNYDTGSGVSNYDTGSGFSDYGGMAQDTGNAGYDNFGSFDMGGGYDEGYAKGGGVLPTSGGQVPRGASPSRGQQTDDIPARLNAGEYVIPRDVVAHQGTKFFNDLIDKSRRLRTGMGGPKPGAQMKPALRMKPSFVSRPGGVV